jgi:hypothetical protein
MQKTPRNYLKYWKVIRQYYKTKFGLLQADLDVLLFMFSERYFTRERFKKFDKILTWDRWRFDKLLKDGWFEVFRPKEGKKRTVYKMSDKGINVVKDIYRKLNGDEIPMTACNNPMFKRKVKYTDKVYKNMIIEMNKSIQQERRGPHE